MSRKFVKKFELFMFKNYTKQQKRVKTPKFFFKRITVNQTKSKSELHACFRVFSDQRIFFLYLQPSKWFTKFEFELFFEFHIRANEFFFFLCRILKTFRLVYNLHSIRVLSAFLLMHHQKQ